MKTFKFSGSFEFEVEAETEDEATEKVEERLSLSNIEYEVSNAE